MFCLSVHCFSPVSSFYVCLFVCLFSPFAVKCIHWDFYFSHCIFQFQNFHLVFLYIFYFLFLFVWSIFVVACWSIFIVAALKSGHINNSEILVLASIVFFIQFECFLFLYIMNYFIETWTISYYVWGSGPYLILILRTDLIWHFSGSGGGVE